MSNAFECDFRNDRVRFVTDNVLWCAWTLDDLNNNGEVEITKEQFQEFVHQCNSGFAEQCSESAHDMFSNFCKENKIKQYKDEEFENE